MHLIENQMDQSGAGAGQPGHHLCTAASPGLLSVWVLAGRSDWLWLESTCYGIEMSALKAVHAKVCFPLLFPLSPSFFLQSSYIHTQPETVGIVFGILVLIFPNTLSDCG